MPVYSLCEDIPMIHPQAWVHPDAVLIGSVKVGPHSTIWPGAVIRGDAASITIGSRTSIQDNSVLHTTAEHPTVIGDECVIGHAVHIEGARIGDRVLVGSNSVVLAAVLESDAAVAAGAVVRSGTRIPAGQRAQGIPARLILNTMEPDEVTAGAAYYVALGERYRTEMRRLA